MSTYNISTEFLNAFADAAGIDRSDAEAQWAGFSNGLSDDKRRGEEDGGEESGTRNGEMFKAAFGNE